MKYIYLNLKRFDITPEFGGVNRLTKNPTEWGKMIVEQTQEKLENYSDAKFTMYFPEAHLLSAVGALNKNSKVNIGCQSVYRDDTEVGGNFGAFTSNRTANSMKSIGCTSTIIGHCEERRDKQGILAEAGVTDSKAVNRILNQEVLAAVNAGLDVLYCIGETMEEQPKWEETLAEQLEIGLKGVDISKIAIAYEPVWAIGPGKTPPNAEYIEKIATFIKKQIDVPVIYGGGLKKENANEIGGISQVDGGLIALTRFSGEIGFYPEEYLEIVEAYLKAGGSN